jgi:phosphoserine phosphatase
MIGVAVLDMDGTLLSKRSIDVFCKELGLTGRLAEVDRRSPSLPAYKVSEMIAVFFRGLPERRLEDLFDMIPLSQGAQSFVSFLKTKGFLVAIATDSYDFLAKRLAKRIGADIAYGNMMEKRDEILTGRLLTEHRCLKIKGCREYSTCKLWFMRQLNEKINGVTLAIGDGESDFCAIGGAELGVAYRPRSQSITMVAHTVASSFSEIGPWLENRITIHREIHRHES